MAAVRLDDEAFSDLRFDALAALCRLADGDHARAKLARLWRQCTQRETYVLSEPEIDAVLGPSGADALVASGLGERVTGGIRLRGTQGRIEWLAKLRLNAARGGEANRRNWENKKMPNGYPDGYPNDSQTDSQNEAKREPKPSPLTLPLTLINTETPYSPPKTPARKVGRPRKPRLGEPTESEAATVREVLTRLGSKNGIRYEGSKSHTALIVGRLRDGYSEMDLRKVIAYCAQQWAGKPEMVPYLRPETLFGPTTITRYIDAARAWFEALPSETKS